MNLQHVGWAPPTTTTVLVGGFRRAQSSRAHPTRPALTLVEVVASTLIVGVMAVAALNSLGAATKSALSSGNRAVAVGLADELVTEALELAYSDPDEPPVFGREDGEGDGPRNVFDDIDDYHAWDETPVESALGVALPDRGNFRRYAAVQFVAPTNPTLATGGVDLGVKRIRAVVEYDGQILAEQFALMTEPD